MPTYIQCKSLSKNLINKCKLKKTTTSKYKSKHVKLIQKSIRPTGNQFDYQCNALGVIFLKILDTEAQLYFMK